MANAQKANIQLHTERWVLVATILASSMAFIDGTALNVALPTLQRDLEMNGAELLWAVNAYALFLAALILVGGSLGDHYGRKRVFGVGIALFSGASIACGLANSPGFLIAARAIQGIGGALMIPGSLALISATIPAERRGRGIGVWSMATTFVTLSGPVLGGWLANQGLWRVVFFINIPLAAVALTVLILRVPESRDEGASKELDVPGALLATLGLAGLTFGFTEAPSRGFSDPVILGTLIGGAIALIMFVIMEWRSDHPMVPLKLFASRTFSGTNLLTLFLYAALSAALFFFPLNLIQVQGYSSDIAGLTLLPFAVLLGLIAPFTGGMVNRFGARTLLTIGPAVTGFGFAALALPGLTGGMADYWLTYFPGQVLLGLGMGITVAPLTTAVMGSAPDEQAGTASGINNAISRTAGVLAIAVLGSVALVTFSGALSSRTESIDMTADDRAALDAESANLAEAQPPASLDAVAATEVETAIDWAFVDTFRLMQLVAAVLAWMSALAAFILVEGDHRHDEHHHKARPVIYPCEGRDPDYGRDAAAGGA